MAVGKVKWFNDTRGFGMIEVRDDRGDVEVFVHYTSIQANGHKTLNVGQEVEFDLYEGAKGFQARNVVEVS